MDRKKWGNRDWVWLVSILIMIMILLVAGFYNSDKVEVNFSIISSAVSLALAIVAIFIALKQDSDNQRVNSQVSSLLSKMSSDIHHVGETVNKWDAREVNKVTEVVVDEVRPKNEEKKKDTFTLSEVNALLDEVERKMKASMDEKHLIEIPISYHKFHEVWRKHPNASPAELQLILKEKYHINVGLNTIINYLN